MTATVSRRAHFNAAHRLYRKDWPFEKNEAVFGKCNSPNFHGHNYELIVSVTGKIDIETGYVIDIKTLADLIVEEVENPFDHKKPEPRCSRFREPEPDRREHICRHLEKAPQSARSIARTRGYAL